MNRSKVRSRYKNLCQQIQRQISRLKARQIQQQMKIKMNGYNVNVLKMQYRRGLDDVKKIKGWKAKDILTYLQIKR